MKMKQYTKQIDGKTVIKPRNMIVVVKGDKQIINPTEEQILADGWEVYSPAPVEPYVPTYEERVEQLIRERYSLNQELAIQRQRETKVDEFNEYFNYCEECKTKAKEEEL
jgi:hypothetical protein